MLADIAPYLALAALAGVAVVGVILYLMAGRQRELADGQRAVLGKRRADDIVEYTLALDDKVDNLREAVTVLTEEVERYRHDLDASLSNIAVVRFDAFRDAGGEQSAAIALLDGYRSGVVISIIASRESARLYVKFLDHGLPDRELSPEEEDAVRRAVPTALARGELSRTPVSTFSRETRRLIDEARRAAAAAQAAVAGEAAGTTGARGLATDEGGEDAGPGPDQLALPRSAFAGPDAELGFAWTEERPRQPERPPDTTPEAGQPPQRSGTPQSTATAAVIAAAVAETAAAPAPAPPPGAPEEQQPTRGGRTVSAPTAAPGAPPSAPDGPPATGPEPPAELSDGAEGGTGATPEETAGTPTQDAGAAPEEHDAVTPEEHDRQEGAATPVETGAAAPVETGDTTDVGASTGTAERSPETEADADVRSPTRPEEGAGSVGDAESEPEKGEEPPAGPAEGRPDGATGGDRRQRVHEDWLGGDELDF